MSLWLVLGWVAVANVFFLRFGVAPIRICRNLKSDASEISCPVVENFRNLLVPGVEIRVEIAGNGSIGPTERG
jgi:hypothetical protein